MNVDPDSYADTVDLDELVASVRRLEAAILQLSIPQPHVDVHVPAQSVPDVHVAPPGVTVSAPNVTVEARKPVAYKVSGVTRDINGHLDGFLLTPVP